LFGVSLDEELLIGILFTIDNTEISEIHLGTSYVEIFLGKTKTPHPC
jgi:hypothetical protein